LADELAELVNNPEERLGVEHKSWLDLDDHKHRADLARHIAAISNFGGGYIVFGIDDDGVPCGQSPELFELTHDILASITKKYLEPSVHCSVREIKSDIGNVHFIVVVPPHGATPICAKVNGPEIKGRIDGIVAGTHYLRKPGPESSSITTAADWKDIIRRCALHDRSAILAAVTAALSDSTSNVKSQGEDEILRLWAEAANKAYVQRIGTNEYSAPIQECRIQLSYKVQTETEESLTLKDFSNLLRVVSMEVDQQVDSAWSLFHVFDRKDTAPRWVSNNTDEGLPDHEFLEASFINVERTFGLDLWRVSPTGFTTVIREYWEDTPDAGMKPRAFLNPITLTKMLGELVRHAEVFSSRFTTPLRVEFLCEWRGLRGRQLRSPNSLLFFSDKEATSDIVRTKGSWAVGKLAREKPEIVAELGGRVARAFNWEQLTTQWVAGQMPTWRRP
jgi:hypothetical protein